MLGLVLLAVLFVAGLVHTRYNFFPAMKFMAWVQFQLSPESGSPAELAAVEDEKKKARRIRKATNREELRAVFSTFDRNKDGFITKQELRESFRNILGMQLTEAEVAEMMEKADSNGDGLMDLDEFCDLFESIGGGEESSWESSEEKKEEDLREAFDVFDGNGDGLITVEELGEVLRSMGLQEGQRLETCKEMIKKVDVDGDGMVSFDEFKLMMKAGPRLVVPVP